MQTIITYTLVHHYCRWICSVLWVRHELLQVKWPPRTWCGRWQKILIFIYILIKSMCALIFHTFSDEIEITNRRPEQVGLANQRFVRRLVGHSYYWISISCHIFYRGSPFVRTRSQVVTNIQYSNNWGRRFLLICRRSTLGQMFENKLWLALVSSSKNVHMYVLYRFF